MTDKLVVPANPAWGQEDPGDAGTLSLPPGVQIVVFENGSRVEIAEGIHVIFGCKSEDGQYYIEASGRKNRCATGDTPHAALIAATSAQ